MTIWIRLLIWFVAWVLISFGYITLAFIEVAQSNDPSAGAAIGFLPFMLPYCFAQAAWIWILAIYSEIVITIYSRRES